MGEGWGEGWRLVNLMITNSDIIDLLADMLRSGQDIRIAVTGRSMGPSFSSVCDLVVRQPDDAAIHAGSLIVFPLNCGWAAHRVLAVRRHVGEIEYLTKGDGLRQLDRPYVKAGDIKGVVVGLGLESGASVDLLSIQSRISARLAVARAWVGLGLRYVLRIDRQSSTARTSGVKFNS